MKKTLIIAAMTMPLLVAFSASRGVEAGSSLCPTNTVCIYMDNNWVGLLGYRAPGQGLANVSSGANDKTSSWENKTATNARWYEHTNGGGFCSNFIAGGSDNDESDTYNDKLSSWATNGACP